MQDKFVSKPKSASHCAVVTGNAKLDLENEEDFLISKIAKFLMHPSWRSHLNNYDGDIAFAVLESSIQFIPNMNPLCLPIRQEIFDNIVDKKGILGGYNQNINYEHDTITRHLKVYEILAINETQCLNIEPNYRNILTQRTFCGLKQTNNSLNGKSNFT